MKIVCSKCKIGKSSSEYRQDVSRKNGRARYCHPCFRVYRNNYYKSHATSWWEGRLKKVYGISGEQYKALLESQDGKCAICSNPEFQKGRGGKVNPLSVDHCHSSGAVRGLLCGRCNRVVGLLHEDLNLLKKVELYISSRCFTSEV